LTRVRGAGRSCRQSGGILNVTFGADLVKLVREGNTRGLFKDRAVSPSSPVSRNILIR